LRQAPTILTDIPQIRNENGAIFTFSAQFSAELAPFAGVWWGPYAALKRRSFTAGSHNLERLPL
jgi:hypothetical protein